MPQKKTSKTPPPSLAGKDPDAVRARLLEVAADEFALKGFAGARLENIAQEVGITRAMIYYYFGGREGLYIAVLEDAYRSIWEGEHAIDWQGLDPEAALRKLVEFRVGYYIAHPNFVALVSIENQHKARYLKRAKSVMASASPSLEHTATVLAKGQSAGVFRKDIDVVDLYQVIVSLAFFNVSNRHTFGAIFGRDATDVGHVRRFVADAVLRYASTNGSRPRAAGRARQ